MNPMKKSNKYYISAIAIAGILFLQGANCFASGANDLNSMIKSVEIVEVPKLEDTDKATHSYLDVDFEQGEQYILYRDRGYELELMGLKTEKRLALEPGKYKAVFKFVENGRYYLIVKDAEVKSHSVSKIEVDDRNIKTYPLKLDEKIDFIAFSQADYAADKIIPYSTLASELSELKTNLELVDITINDGKSELWLRHPDGGIKEINGKRELNIELNFFIDVENSHKSQRGYRIESKIPSGYRLNYYTYNGTEYIPKISLREKESKNAQNVYSAVELALENDWKGIKLRRQPLDGEVKYSIDVFENVFPYPIKLNEENIEIKDYYTQIEERIEGSYPKGLRASIYKLEKENGEYRYEYQKEYDLEAKHSLILPDEREGVSYAARLYGQSGSVIYDFVIPDIREKSDILDANLPKGIALLMATELKDKIDDIVISQDLIDGKIYSFKPVDITKIVTNFQVSPVVELGIKSGDYRYYLSHRSDRTYFPMEDTIIDIASDVSGIATVGDMSVSTDRIEIHQNFMLEGITKNGKILEPTNVATEMDDMQFDLSTGRLYFKEPLKEGKLNFELKYDIENNIFNISNIGHVKNVLNLDGYRDAKIYPVKMSKKLYDLRLKPEYDTIDTAEYKVYNSSNEAKSIKFIEKDQKLYLDLGAQDFSDTYTVVIDTLKLKNRTLKNVIFKIKHERN
jgi:hypothetical protein